MLIWSEKVGAKPGAAADHLPELCIGANDLEEHQIDHLRHVDAGIKHVDRDGNVRSLVTI